MTPFAERIKNFFGLGKTLSEEVFEDLTDLLVEGDFGAAQAYELSEKLRERCKKEKTGDGEDAKKARIPVSVADSGDESTFWFPAIAKASGIICGIISEDGNHIAVKNAAEKIRKTMEGGI